MSQQVLALLNSVPPSVYQRFSISILTLQGISHARLHDFADAQAKLSQADEACLHSDEPTCGAVARAHGVLALEQGQFTVARHFFTKTLDIADKKNDRFLKSTALLNLGAVALQQGHFDEAIDWSTSALKLATTINARDIVQVALGNLGWAYYKLGDVEKASDDFRKAAGTATELGDDLYQLRWTTTAGYVLLDHRDYVGAEEAYTRALSVAKRIRSTEDIFNALISLALVYEATGHLEQAQQYAQAALDMAPSDGNPLDELYSSLVKGRLSAIQHREMEAEKIFTRVDRDPKSDVSLKWEAEHALAKLYEDENRPTQADPEYRAALKTFETARSELKHEESELPFLTNASRIYDDYVHFLIEHGKADVALQVADFTRARTLAEGLGLLKTSKAFAANGVDANAAARRAGATFFFYWLGEKQSYLWVIGAQKEQLIKLPPEKEIKTAVERYERALVGPQDVLENSNADGTWLYETLIAPALSMVPKNGKVIIIPDGSLNGLNFETLLVRGPRVHYWIEDATVSDASSLRLVGSSATATKGQGKLLMIGNPLTNNRDYGALPNAAVEMEKIEKHFPSGDRTAYAQESATASAYRESKPEQFSYIHFVAHGTASRTSPLDSAVVLSPSGPQEDSFKLYARDVIRCPLHARLVTISTCYGAGTRAYTGEGLVGLSWAFLRAGAHNVVGALWEVNDTSTPQLMDRFYAELTTGKSPDVALREAKLEFLHSSSAFRKPYYWAPFQLYTGQ